MHFYFTPLSQQLRQLTQWIMQAEYDVQQGLEGTLILLHRKNHYEYYRQIARQRSYISMKNENQIRALAQKDYARKFLRHAYALKKEMSAFQKSGAERSASFMYQRLADVYDRLSEQRKKLVLPYVLPDQEYIAAWLSQPYQGGTFGPNDPVITSEKGERVRSKSEKLIADKYRVLGIPYRYEYPVYLRGLGNVYCDFTLLDMQERAEVRHEHLGMMQKGSYILKNLRKIDAYSKNGYAVGREILYSFESDEHVLDMEALETVIRSRFF